MPVRIGSFFMGHFSTSKKDMIVSYNIKNIGGEVLNLDGPLETYDEALQLADLIEMENDIDVVIVEIE